MSDLLKQACNLPPDQLALHARCVHPTGTFVEFNKEEVEQSIPDRFEKIVGLYSHRVAVKVKDDSCTYETLNREANRIAQAILARCGQGSEPIALLFERPSDIIVGILGALKAGKFYLVLDSSFPLERITCMLDDSQARLILTNERSLGLADRLSRRSRQLLNTDELDESLSAANLRLSLSPDALACLIYTSGSTGKPKGVRQTHLNILHEIMTYTNGFHICAQDRLTLLASCSSGQGIKNTLCALLNGAGLYPLNIKSEGVNGLSRNLSQEEITVYHSSVNLFRCLLKALAPDQRFPGLRLIRLASQQVLKEDMELLRQHFSPQCVFVNALSTTETGTFRWYFMNPGSVIGESTVPVGYAVDGKEVRLLDDERQEVAINEVGEIAVKSRYVSPGYWRKPRLTRSKFLPDPNGGDQRLYLTGDLGRLMSDGCLVYLGRKDLRVKIRGYSVEIAEVERALLAHSEVKEAAVLGREREPGEQCLVAYIVVHSQERAPATNELSAFLKETLPDYMIPSAFVMLDAMPTTANGKIARLALPLAGQSRPNIGTPFVAPRNPVEEQLARIWSEVLSLDRVGIHDNFFELGGHSLAAARVVSQIIKAFQLDLPLLSLFQSPTIAEMAVVVAENHAKHLDAGELNRILSELESLSDSEVERLLAGGTTPANPKRGR